MTFTHRTFEIDLRDSPQPLAVQLDAAPLQELLDHADFAHRLYELALVGRPGDVWEYLEVVPQQLPPPLAARLDLKRATARSAGRPWPDHRVPFDVFDREVRAEPGEAAEAWSEACEGEEARGFIRHLFEHLQAHRTDAARGLVAHERARIVAGAHPFANLPRERAIAASRRNPPNSPVHTDDFYAMLFELVSGKEVASAAVRGLGDYRLLRILCERQRTRGEFEISATTEREVNNEAWDAQVAYYAEDIGQGFLFVQDGPSSGKTVKDLVETYTKLGPGGLILSSQDEGEIAGFTREQGDGWYLYRSEVTPHMLPNLRRYHNVLALMLAQENGELSDTQVVEIIAQWENFVTRRKTNQE